MAEFVYIFTNVCMPGLCKIGFTSRTPKERAAELSISTAVPAPFEVAWSREVPNSAADVERLVHSSLSDRRFRKEFFRCDVELAIAAIEQVADKLFGRAERHAVDEFRDPARELDSFLAREILPLHCWVRDHRLELRFQSSRGWCVEVTQKPGQRAADAQWFDHPLQAILCFSERADGMSDVDRVALQGKINMVGKLRPL